MHCGVSIVQHPHDNGRWRVLLEYDDGDQYLSRTSYENEDQAKDAAFKASLEIGVPLGSG